MWKPRAPISVRLNWSCLLLVAWGGLGVSVPLPLAHGASVLAPAGVRVQVRARAETPGPGIGFQRRPELESRLAFTNQLSRAARTRNRILENGSGVALGDVDGDGLTDLYVARLEGDNRLFRNLGNWGFEPLANAGGASCSNQLSTGVLLADFDGDQALDLVVSSVDQPTQMFLNRGDGRWIARGPIWATPQAGATSLAAADVDRDGDLDLYVARYRERTVKDEQLELAMRRENGLWVVPPEHRDRFISTRNRDGRGILLEQGLPDGLLLNDGHAKWTPVEWTSGYFRNAQGEVLTDAPRDWSLSASFADVNDDGFPDLYVCSDFATPDRFWLNQGGMGFRAINRAALTYTSWSSMCVDWADVDRDGDWDFFVGDMLSHRLEAQQYQRANRTPNAWTDWSWGQRPQFMRNTFYLNRGNESFAEVAWWAGLAASDWTWNSLWLDVDRDGYEDLLVTNGHPHDSQDADWARELSSVTATDPEARLRLPALDTPNLLFRNRGDGTFEERGESWGFAATTHGQGAALGDLDGDGDLDVVVNPLNQGVEIYENLGTGSVLGVVLRDRRPSNTVVGSKLTLRQADGKQLRELRAGGRYLSSDGPLLTFGTSGAAGNDVTLEIRWPDGLVSEIAGLPPHARVEVERIADGESVAKPESGSETFPWFVNRSDRLGQRHVDEPFDDARHQGLLEEQLSQLGPAVGWIDWNGNGWDDVVTTSGRGGLTVRYQNQRGERFDPVTPKGGVRVAAGDQLAVIGWGMRECLILESGYEAPEGAGSRLLRLGSDGVATPVPVSGGSLPQSVGALTAGDVDLDGDLDLFVGGRHMVGRYPAAPPSVLLRNEGGRFQVDDAASAVVSASGMVTAAVFCHLDADQRLDLAVATDWGPVRVFRNGITGWMEVTETCGLARWTGQWRSLACGDFDRDGRLDLVAGNVGMNRRVVRGRTRPGIPDQPLRLYYGRIEGGPSWLHLGASFEADRSAYFPWIDRDQLVALSPLVEQRFPRYRDYAAATVEEVIQGMIEAPQFLTVETTESAAFLNRGEQFEFRALPLVAQEAPVLGVTVADLDGDGAEDLFLSQNFHGTPLETAPDDAGLGMWLRGDGRGAWNAVPLAESGITVFGSGRSCAVGDWNRDGRWDLLVGRHGRAPRFFQNERSQIGLRVRLLDSATERAAVGARLRVETAVGWGPLRTLTAGGGSGSQDSRVAILHGVEEPKRVWVKWPDGSETNTEVPSGAGSITVRPTGQIAEWTR